MAQIFYSCLEFIEELRLLKHCDCIWVFLETANNLSGSISFSFYFYIFHFILILVKFLVIFLCAFVIF